MENDPAVCYAQIKYIKFMNIKTDDICKKEFENLKYHKIDARYIVYHITKEFITIDRIGQKEQTWDSFINSLPDNELRFCVFDFEFKNKDNMKITKLIFISWNPDSSPLKGRVLYSTAKESFKSYLDLNTKDYTLCSKGDMTRDDMIKELDK